jgi:predicted GIY-YIG superfamily endonuclease
MGIGLKGASFRWTGERIIRRAPQASGVYAIFSTDDWIYVGEAGNLRARLLAHFDGPNVCFKRNEPMGFQFELVPAKQRAARKNELIGELKPVCNRG